MTQTLGKLNLLPVSTNLHLVAKSTATLLTSIPEVDQGVSVAEIDPTFSDTAAFCTNYGIDPGQTVNCVIIKATRAEKTWYAACLIFGNTRADVNGLVRRHLDARKASFAPMDEAVNLTGMEYGGITAVGLPIEWPILIDKAVAEASQVVIGSGIRSSKLVVSGKFMASLPNAVVLENLGAKKG
ncbi:MAG: YbaK/EbsC family protein [Candidatus Paceibacterota bacterium]|jgi:prolyl-tRNA editing enzyme YbaK/EbsC (Cys-tRNA(Pro) deacylase)